MKIRIITISALFILLSSCAKCIKCSSGQKYCKGSPTYDSFKASYDVTHKVPSGNFKDENNQDIGECHFAL